MAAPEWSTTFGVLRGLGGAGFSFSFAGVAGLWR